MATHATMKEARGPLEEAAGDGAAGVPTSVWARGRDEWLLHPVAYIKPGAPVTEFPWHPSPAATI
jgi:hypothetical protein